MRVLFLLLAVVLAFFLVRWFRPQETTLAQEDPVAAAAPRFLTPPEPGDSTLPVAPVAAPQARSQEASRSPSAGPPAAWPAGAGSGSGGEDASVAEAVAHGAPTDVQAAAASLATGRALLLESFVWAVAGERDMALDLSRRMGREGGTAEERALLEAALTGRAPGLTLSSEEPVARAMQSRLLAREASQALAARQYPEAARAYSSLLVGEISAPWPEDRRLLGEWSQALAVAQREHRWSPRGSWPSREVKVQSGDSLIALRQRHLAEHPDALLCTGLIERANRLKGYIQPNQVLKIPVDQVRILVDLSARWALFFMGDEVAAAWPVGIGRPGEDTPPGEYTLRNKLENPPWMKEGQEPIPFGDPRNPLGTRWMGWSQGGGRTSYGFHGTWDPASIGQAASDGCIRFANGDVEELFQILPEGAPIRIQE